MTEAGPSFSALPNNDSSSLPSPIMPEAHRSRPLSEISENDNRRRSSRQSVHSVKGERSRPVSEVKDDRRLSAHIATITLNLNDYASAAKRASTSASTKSRDSLTSAGPSKKPERPMSYRTASVSSIKEVQKDPVDKTPEVDTKEGHPLLLAKRASLRPSPLGATYADVAKSEPPTPSIQQPNPIPTQSVVSLVSARSSLDSNAKPLPKTKPSWLRRASGQVVLRTKSKSPSPSEESLTSSPSLPPELPPRPTAKSPEPGISYASIAAAPGPSRSRLADGVGRPALAQPSRDSNIRSRIAAWTTAAQPGMSRSESSNTIASTASAFTSAQQRIPASAQRMIGSAGSAVQKGWAGLRARGMGGSISGMSSVAPEPPKFPRKQSRDRSVSAQATMGSSDGPVLHPSAILRPAGARSGRVFGQDITEAGKAWGVADVGDVDPWEKRRRECLPAVVIRAVDYCADIDMSECHPGDLDPHAVSGLFKSYLRDYLSPRFESAVRKSSSIVDLGEPEDMSTLLPLLPSAHWFLLADIIRLLQLIPSHSATNRMTLNALMLSLGPSLNIPGAVLTELLERRDELFTTPPPVTGTEAALDLIDFGETSVALATIEDISRSSSPTSISRHPLETPLVLPVVDKPRKALSLPKKPSLSRLFNSTSPVPPKKDEAVVQSSPPRIELRTDSPKLPSFEIESQEIVETQNPVELEKELPKEPELEYPSGSVEERARLFSTSTPIADMFSGTARLPPLRSGGSSNGSLRSASSSPSIGLGFGPEVSALSSSATNPASVRRRGPPVFFQAGTERQGRSTSGGSSNGGVKRKEETGSETEELGEDRVKRLSAGPGGVSVREAVRSREMMA